MQHRPARKGCLKHPPTFARTNLGPRQAAPTSCSPAVPAAPLVPSPLSPPPGAFSSREGEFQCRSRHCSGDHPAGVGSTKQIPAKGSAQPAQRVGKLTAPFACTLEYPPLSAW